MKIIVCVDDSGGMMFNNRRQSRDRTLIADVIETVSDSKLYIDKYSEKLFVEYEGKYTVAEDMLYVADSQDFCFVENKQLQEFMDKIDEIIIYRWNRRYPSDFYFDIDMNGFKLCSADEFEGYSHDVITKEIFRR